MTIKIEQITKTGLVVNDFDNKLSIPNICKIFSKYIKITSTKNPFNATYKNKSIQLCVKNISYLGIPHPHYKKRIQIPESWKKILQNDNTLLLGIYSYKNSITFCLFDTKKYKNNRLNNSSAHIHTMDLYQARKLGIFKKTDNMGNNITVFTKDNFNTVFDEVLFNKTVESNNEINVFQEFSKTLSRDWKGIDCYQEMINAKFNNAYQPEWAGFYLEYKLKHFLNNNPSHQQYCKYLQNKQNDEIDLDLWFSKEEFYGDLKTHTINQNLLGNDKNTVHLAINNYQKIWYIAFAHHTKKDKDFGGITTRFWNQSLNDRYKITGKGKIKELNSYLLRMKNSVKLDHFVILEINQFNKQYLSDFNQGRNSNNTDRKVKISIKNKDIQNDNFAIYRQKLL